MSRGKYLQLGKATTTLVYCKTLLSLSNKIDEELSSIESVCLRDDRKAPNFERISMARKTGDRRRQLVSAIEIGLLKSNRIWLARALNQNMIRNSFVFMMNKGAILTERFVATFWREFKL